MLVISILVASCTFTNNLSNRAFFEPIVGRSFETRRVTYIYDFDQRGEVELWNHTYKYTVSDDIGNFWDLEEDPLAVCESGSPVQIDSVKKISRFDNPVVVKAFGTIECGAAKYEFSYLWGFYPHVHDAPWESETYKVGVKRDVSSTS